MEQSFAREDLPIADRLRLVATRVAGHLDAESAAIYIAEPDASRFRMIASGTEAGTEGLVPMTAGLIARAYRNGESFFLASRLARSGETQPGAAPANLVLAPIGEGPALGVFAVECVVRVATDLEELTRLVGRLALYLARLAEIHRDHGVATRQGILFEKLANIAPRLMVQHDLESLAGESLNALRELFGRGLVTVRLRGPEDKMLFRSAFEGSEAERPGMVDLEQARSTIALEQAEESSSVTPTRAAAVAERGGADFACVPIRSADRLVGALGVVSPPAAAGAKGAVSAFGNVELEALRKLALYVALAWEQSRPEGAAPVPAQDPVTGLLAGSGLESKIMEEVKRAERYHDRILLTICSISGYERLEQRHGAPWAEGLLRDFAHALTRNVREVDAVARIGGGRVAVLSPETDKDSGALLKRLDHLLPTLPSVKDTSDPGEVRLVGRQYTYPDEVPTAGELLALIRTSYSQ
jgi:diguanylate cyclase (GGDEF)-like protein